MDKRKLKSFRRNHVLAFKHILQAACISLIWGCNSTPNVAEKPTWIVSPPQSQQMIYGVGSAPVYQDERTALNQAMDNARLEIAKRLNVTVSGNTQVSQSQINGTMAFEFREAIKNSAPAIELNGVVNKESYVDSVNKTAYALAEFNKDEAEFDLLSKVMSIDNQMDKMAISLKGSGYERLKQAIAVQKKFVERNQLNAQLAQLGFQKSMLTNHQQALLTRMNQVFSEVTFSIEPSKDDNLADQIAQALAAQGMNLSNQGDLAIRYDIKWFDMNNNDMFYSIANATVTVSADGKTIKTFVDKAKGGSQFKERAQEKAIDKLAVKMVQLLAEQLLQ